MGKTNTLCSEYDGYDQVGNPMECETASSFLKKQWFSNTENADDYPPGCHYHLDDKIVLFNLHDIGSANEDIAPICIKG